MNVAQTYRSLSSSCHRARKQIAKPHSRPLGLLLTISPTPSSMAGMDLCHAVVVAALALFGCQASVTTDAAGAATPHSPAAAPSPAGPLTSLPPVTTDNKNLVIATSPSAVTISASSSYGGWPPNNATDGNPQTSWYSASNDSAAHGAAPFLQLSFNTPSTVRRVTILGNRDPNGRALASLTSAGTGNRRDFDFRLANPVANVKMIRFTSIQDEGNQNEYGDVAIAEIQVE